MCVFRQRIQCDFIVQIIVNIVQTGRDRLGIQSSFLNQLHTLYKFIHHLPMEAVDFLF
jgi:hypothetical protein